MDLLHQDFATERVRLSDSFSDLHQDLDQKQTPAIRDSLTKLTASFDEARIAFDEKVAAFQEPVKDAQAARDGMDAEGVAHQFSDVHRRQMDRKVQEAEIKALREELNLLKGERTFELQAQEAELAAEKARIDARMSELQAVLANYNGGDNSSSQNEAKAAQSEINELTRQQSKIQGQISDKKKEVVQVTSDIRDLEREIGSITGTSAPAQYTWMQGLTAGLQDYLDKLEEATLTSDNFADKVVEVGQVATDSLGDALFDMATGAKSVGEAFGDMAEAILKAILKILAEQVAIFAIKQLFAAFGFSPQTFATGGEVKGFATGGQVKGYARGGEIPSLGLTGRDAVPIMAQAGEYVIRNSAAASIGKDKLHALNSMGAAALDNREVTAVALPESGSKEVNVYVMAPDEKPSLGPDDILHVIGQDIATGGQTKQLIKHAVMQ